MADSFGQFTLWVNVSYVVAHHISPGQASKDGRFDEALYMESSLMQHPSQAMFDDV